MTLSGFINENRESILEDWTTFASTCGPASEGMGTTALRDHAGAMLTAIAKDLDTYQTPGEQERKSLGMAAGAARTTAAHEHGTDRAESGFTLEQMVSEYRALRASVIRLWTQESGQLGAPDIEDLIRFNEAIDQALAESVVRYTQNLDQSREMFVGILGHDLRSPLGAVITSATFMIELDELEEPYRSLTARIASSSRRMDRMVSDLLDLTRSRFGGGIPIERADMDLRDAVREVVSELGALHTAAEFDVRFAGDLRGRWDPGRVGQVLVNLIGNAVEHGAAATPVTVDVGGDAGTVRVLVHNHGTPIPESLLRRIFDPMKTRQGGSSEHLGLGLYIADRIVTAHGGSIDVESSASAGTTFTVHLPRSE
jgi:signal transduction histidine kinase